MTKKEILLISKFAVGIAGRAIGLPEGKDVVAEEGQAIVIAAVAAVIVKEALQQQEVFDALLKDD